MKYTKCTLTVVAIELVLNREVVPLAVSPVSGEPVQFPLISPTLPRFGLLLSAHVLDDVICLLIGQPDTAI